MNDFRPESMEAGYVAQLVANIAKECWYPDCNGEVVACAVHRATVAKPNKGGYNMNGSDYLPVCEKHKRWEFAKVSGVEPWELEA